MAKTLQRPPWKGAGDDGGSTGDSSGGVDCGDVFYDSGEAVQTDKADGGSGEVFYDSGAGGGSSGGGDEPHYATVCDALEVNVNGAIYAQVDQSAKTHSKTHSRAKPTVRFVDDGASGRGGGNGHGGGSGYGGGGGMTKQTMHRPLKNASYGMARGRW
jgi:hypothetical protein